MHCNAYCRCGCLGEKESCHVTIACNGAGGRVGFEINASRAGPLMRVDYEVPGLQVAVATVFGSLFST